MAVVCFRFAPAGSDDDQEIDRLNEAIVERVNAAGDAYITQTRLSGRIVMRVGIGNVLTTVTHVEQVWARIRTEARTVAAPITGQG
jgi:aromatic-L-amino-acid decarboxylase